jgi:hypothetical protein
MPPHDPEVPRLTQTRSPLRRWLPVALIATGAIVGAIFLRDHLSFDALRENREALIAYREAHPVTMPLLFMAAYAAIVAFSLCVDTDTCRDLGRGRRWKGYDEKVKKIRGFSAWRARLGP